MNWVATVSAYCGLFRRGQPTLGFSRRRRETTVVMQAVEKPTVSTALSVATTTTSREEGRK